MKKILFGTTALAVAMAAGTANAGKHESPVTIEFSGFSSIWFSATSRENGQPYSGVASGATGAGAAFIPALSAGLENQGFTDYSELYWRVAYDVENLGIQVGVKGEMRLHNNTAQNISILGGAASAPVDGVTIDENYLFIEGEHGQVQIGDTDSAADTMFVTMAGDNTAIGGYGGALQDIDNLQRLGLTVTTTVGTTGLGLSEDSGKIAYFTPRFADIIQFGASFAPGSSNTSGSVTDTGTPAENYVSFGANVTTEVSGVKIEAAAGIERALSTDDDVNFDEVGRQGFGIKASAAGFEVGGSINKREFTGSDLFTAVPGLSRNEQDQVNYEIGAAYSGAPHWRVGVTYANSEQADRSVDYWGVGGRFAVHQNVIFFAGHNKSDNNLSSNSLPFSAAINAIAPGTVGAGFNGDRSRTYAGMMVKF